MRTARSSLVVLAHLPSCGFNSFEGSVISPDLRFKNFHLFISSTPIKAKIKRKKSLLEVWRLLQKLKKSQLGSAAVTQGEQFPLLNCATTPLQSPALQEKLISGCFHISAQKPQKFNSFKSQATHTPGTELLNPLNRT